MYERPLLYKVSIWMENPLQLLLLYGSKWWTKEITTQPARIDGTLAVAVSCPCPLLDGIIQLERGRGDWRGWKCALRGVRSRPVLTTHASHPRMASFLPSWLFRWTWDLTLAKGLASLQPAAGGWSRRKVINIQMCINFHSRTRRSFHFGLLMILFGWILCGLTWPRYTVIPTLPEYNCILNLLTRGCRTYCCTGLWMRRWKQRVP